MRYYINEVIRIGATHINIFILTKKIVTPLKFNKDNDNMPQTNTRVTFKNGASMPNRFMLAPLTNTQSHADGTLSDEEYRWLTMRAEGGFGLTMTCASHVQFVGKGFPGAIGYL